MGFNATKQKTERTTYEGAKAFKIRNPKMELYLLAASSMMSGDTFYESMDDRLLRFRRLVSNVLERHPKNADWIARLAMYTREQMHMRTIPTMLIAELFMAGYADEASAASWRVFVRGDEHLEALAYFDVCGSKRTKRFLKCIAAHLNSASEQKMVKYASGRRAYSQKDAIRLAHPEPKDAAQSALFKYMVHGWGALDENEGGLLKHVASLKQGETQTWEQHISKEGSSAEAWAEAVPKMGYMAMLRNLRNMVEKGIPEKVLVDVAKDIENPTKVRFSRQLPFRFLSAWKALPINTPGYLKAAVARALDYSTANVPDFTGDTLVLVDTSGSMGAPISTLSSVSAKDAALTLGAIAVNAMSGDMWCFGTVPIYCRVVPGTPVLGIVDGLSDISYQTGNGTAIGRALCEALENKPSYKRAIVCTDMQSNDYAHGPVLKWLGEDESRNLYIIDLRGYGRPFTSCDTPGVHMIGGFSDRVFNWMEAAEKSSPVEMIGAYE
jgi:60 kDa SS-A/Ro ribonucleoprotein